MSAALPTTPPTWPQADVGQIKRFLDLLGKQKGSGRFRGFFPSGDPRKAADKGRKGPDKGASPLEMLQEWQAEGRGAYVVINDGGDSKKEITACRALFCEWDDKPIEWQVGAWRELDLPEPTMQVVTGGKSVHCYWVLAEPIDPDRWRALQTRLLDHADADRTLTNPSRVMRLPGCWYMRAGAEPGELVQIVHESGRRYTAAEITACLPEVEPPSYPRTPVQTEHTPTPGAVPLEALLSRELERMARQGSPEGSRDADCFSLAASALAHGDAGRAAGLSVEGTAEELVLAFAARCSPPFPPAEALKCLRSAESKKREPDAGWPERLRWLRDQLNEQAKWRALPAEQAPILEKEALHPSPQVGQEGDRSRAPARQPQSDHRRLLRELQGMARGHLQEKLPPHERIALLRAAAIEGGLSLRDGEILAITAHARRELQGKASAATAEDEFDIPDEVWAWDQVIAARTPNLLVALQKVGKTALMAGLISAWEYGAGNFLGLDLHGPCPPVIIAGTDQTMADWRAVLAPAGLMQKQANGRWKLCGPIVTLWHRSQPVYLDMAGIEDIARACEQHPGALLLCDTYAALISPLGLDEAKPEAAEPLYNLMEMIEPFGATPVLLHHASKSRANERASNASRNSNAIPAAVSQIISMQWLEPDRKSDQRINLTTEGRNSKPIDLVIEQVDRSQWISHGSTETIREQQRIAKVEGDLNARQAGALEHIRTAWGRHQELAAPDLVKLMPHEFEGTDPSRAARDTLKQLYDKGLLDKRTKSEAEANGTVVRFRPRANPLARGGIQKHPPQPPQPPQPPNASQRFKPSPLSPEASGGEAEEAAGTGFADPRARGIKPALPLTPLDDWLNDASWSPPPGATPQPMAAADMERGNG